MDAPGGVACSQQAVGYAYLMTSPNTAQLVHVKITTPQLM